MDKSFLLNTIIFHNKQTRTLMLIFHFVKIIFNLSCIIKLPGRVTVTLQELSLKQTCASVQHQQISWATAADLSEFWNRHTRKRFCHLNSFYKRQVRVKGLESSSLSVSELIHSLHSGLLCPIFHVKSITIHQVVKLKLVQLEMQLSAGFVSSFTLFVDQQLLGF